MTGIQWTQRVWNPTTGCDKVSPGCGLPRFEGDHPGGCYAMAMAARLKGMGQAKYQTDGDPRTSGPGFGLAVHPDALVIPFRWRKPQRVFVNSMSDLFHDKVPASFIASVFAVMAGCPQHTFQVLTKRHGRMRSLLSREDFWLDVFMVAENEFAGSDRMWPLRNVWLGVSVEDQHWADIRIPALLDTPAAVRFISAEPLLGPIDLSWVAGIDALERDWAGGPGGGTGAPHPLLSWVIAGGESGPGARPCDLSWLRSLGHQCAVAEVPFFCKQLGAVLGRELGAGSHGADWDTWPRDLRVRQFPGGPVQWATREPVST